MSVVVEAGVVSECGRQLRAAAQQMPERVAVPGESAGQGDVDESVREFLTSLGECFVGGTTAVHVLGQNAVAAADAFVEADRSVPEVRSTPMVAV